MLTKRIFDLVASLFGLFLLSPVFLIISLAVYVEQPFNPIFFRQQRVGRYGKLFTLVKFRTMFPDQNGNSITVAGESRITNTGRFLRKHKLDELPELWNVVVGEMSLVGPRPDVPGYADKLVGDDRRILNLRPGITGPATLKYSDEEMLLSKQPDPVRFNDQIVFPDKVRINLFYLERRTIWLDLRIILCTLTGRKLKLSWAQ